jgi:hypothetical protein
MLDVRNAIANVVDRYTLANVVEVTLRKMRSNNVNLPFVVNPRATPRASKPASRSKPAKTSVLTPPLETGLGEFLYREGI